MKHFEPKWSPREDYAFSVLRVDEAEDELRDFFDDVKLAPSDPKREAGARAVIFRMRDRPSSKVTLVRLVLATFLLVGLVSVYLVN